MTTRLTATFLQPGDTINLLAPRALSGGGGVLVGNIFAVATRDIASGVTGPCKTDGVHMLTKTSAQAWTQGQKIYWDDTNFRCDSDGTVGPLIGTATATAANPSSTGAVRLNGTAASVAQSTSVATVAAAGSTQADAAALPLGGFCKVTGANATVGVLLPPAVAGRQLHLKNGAAAVLKIWPASGDAINAIAADSSMSIASLTTVILTAYDSTTWYTTPLLPS